MKRLILTLIATIVTMATLSAQNYIVVNSEKIFKSIEAYNTAISDLEKIAEGYQTQVDTKFREVETLYNNYMAQKSALSESNRNYIENQILIKEQEATKFQESIFGADGTLMKKRIELIQPIQQRVFKVIEEYAQASGYEMVLDVAQNAEVLYYSPKADHTQAIIERVKSSNKQ